MDEKKILLPESRIPRRWYNIQADMKLPPPPLHPQTGNPIQASDLLDLFPMELIKQEVSTERWIEIPDEVVELYRLWRVTPLVRARQLEKALDTPAKIFYKYEGTSPSGSHKSNTAIPQAYYNKQAGIRRITTETGAGQWGSAVSMACHFFGLECVVYMVRVSYEQKPYRRSLMRVYGANVLSSPTSETETGRKMNALDPNSPGSLGLAISEAVEDARSRTDTNYALGSVLNHVLLHQTIIGLEAKEQLEMVDAYPDVIVGACGGGSNFAGIAFPFLFGEKKVRAVAVEPTACPSLTQGVYAYDFGDIAHMTPKVMMYTLGHTYMPPSIHSGGLRYHGASSLVSKLFHDGLIEARSLGQKSVFEAARLFAQTEGIVAAPESSHAIRGAIDEALHCKETGEAKTILFCLSGHGHFDLSAYDSFLAGEMEDAPPSKIAIKEGIQRIGL